MPCLSHLQGGLRCPGAAGDGHPLSVSESFWKRLSLRKRDSANPRELFTRQHVEHTFPPIRVRNVTTPEVPRYTVPARTAFAAKEYDRGTSSVRSASASGTNTMNRPSLAT